MDQPDKKPPRLGRIVCVLRGYTVTEVLTPAENGVQLAGFRVFGPGAASDVVHATAEDAMRAIDELTGDLA